MDQFKLPIAVYARYSSEMQNERSCEDQVIECKQFIERQDDLRGQPIEIFTDNAISGSFITNRPSMMRLMEAIKQQKISAIVSESLDRISRNLSETDEIFRLCTYYGIPIFTVMEGRIEKVMEGRVQKIHVGLSGTINSIFKEQIAHRVKRGQAGNIRQGKAAGSPPFKLTIAVYARYSSDLQNERSCKDQVIECKQYIDRQDDLRGRPTELFSDNAISGSFITNRPSMMRLIDAIKQQKIAAIVSESLDRISRSLSETDEIFRLCTYYDIPIFTVMEGEIKKIHVGLSGTMSSMHIEQIAHRVKRGKAGNIR